MFLDNLYNTWWKISISVCVFGFLKEFRPSEPFIFEFLIGEWRNVTSDDVYQKVFPVNTYSYLSLLVIVFLITDLCRYKPLLVVLGSCGIIIWSMLLWTTSLLALQILEVIYGVYMATEVAYYTYMYAKVSRENYQKVTGHARVAILGGRCVSAVLSQLLVSFDAMDYRQLNYITLSAQIGATIWSFTLPSVSKSIYFNQESLVNTKLTLKKKWKQAFLLMWKHFKMSYSKSHVVKWSLWWAMATSIFIQTQNYIQPLWSDILETDDSGIYNGAIEALSMLLSILGTLTAGSLKTNWEPIRELMLTFTSVVIGGLLVISSQTKSIFVAYGCYVFFNIIYQYMITAATSEVSKHILDDTYGLVFGLNTFVALILQTVLTLVVVNPDIGFGLSPRNQFVVYGGYFFVIACIYFIFGFIKFVKMMKKRKQIN